MELKQGIVQLVSQKKSKTNSDMFGLKIDGEWFNGFGVAPAGKGDAVTVSYEKTAYGNSVKKVDIATKATALTRDERIKAQDDRMLGMLISYIKDTRPQIAELLKGKATPQEVEVVAREIVFRDYRAAKIFLDNAEEQTKSDQFVSSDKLVVETIKI